MQMARAVTHTRIKNDILGKKYSLSIALVSAKISGQLNKKYRRKRGPTNVLAFPYSLSEGEILLCPSVMKKEAKGFNMSYQKFLRYLVIHGMLHLKGYRHGSRMDKAQDFYLAKYGTKHLDRNRHGLGHHTSRGRRVRKGGPRKTKS